MDIVTLGLMFGTGGAPPGQVEWTVRGTYSFIVPDNVYWISAVVVGAGQGGGRYSSSIVASYNGPSGALRWIDRIPVTPGETLTVEVGAGGSGNNLTAGGRGASGGITRIRRGTTTLLYANGADGLARATGTPKGVQANGSIVGGGDGSSPVTYTGNRAIGGGGAPGYDGDGAQGSLDSGTGQSGQGGGAGAGTGYSTYTASGGGGVGLKGQGSNGTGGTIVTSGSAGTSPTGGSGGSGGQKGGDGNGINESIKFGGDGGWPGGGGGGAGGSGNGGGTGADGGARIIWGPNRFYPSTNTQDV